MLRYKNKEDLEAVFAQVDESVDKWRVRESEASDDLRAAFGNKLLISLIFHDAALEGEVLSHGEIKAAIDSNIISDASLIPSYEEISNFHQAALHGFGLANKKNAASVDTLRDIRKLLLPDEEGGPSYRKENPLHRLYYHEISAPAKIPTLVKELEAWLSGEEAASIHPVNRAATAHFKVMSIFPWAKQTGRAARIFANMMLLGTGYPIAVIHSIDRQRYYESLRTGNQSQLLSVYLEAVKTTADSAVRVYDEAANGRRAS